MELWSHRFLGKNFKRIYHQKAPQTTGIVTEKRDQIGEKMFYLRNDIPFRLDARVLHAGREGFSGSGKLSST
jgi:hypothetical protein